MRQKMDAMKLSSINNISNKERRLEGGKNQSDVPKVRQSGTVSAPLKGILFGSGLILLSLALLSVSFLMFKTSVQSSMDTSRMAVIDRIKDEISSVENAYSVILARYVNATARGNNISFLETLPEGASGGFFTEISRFETFARNNSDFVLGLNLSPGTNLPLSLPKGVIYTHERGFGGNMTGVQSASSVTSYIVNVTVNRTGAPDLSWLSISEAANGVRFSIEAKGLTGVTRYDTRILSKNVQSVLLIDVPGTTADPRIFVGNASDPGGLKIHNNGTDALFLNVTVEINVTEALFVSFPQQTINITSEEYNISRTSAIRIR